MSSDIDASSSTGPKETGIPPISSFEFAKESIGAIKKSVNLFRGSACIPIDLLTLPGHPGLDIKVTAIYSSNIKNAIETWNIQEPTGILGLGWDMPLDYISVYKNGSGSPTSDDYYLFSSGTANPMVKTSEIEGKWSFQLRSHEFWQILYDPQNEVWTIVKENGFIFTYGGKDPNASAIQWGVKWGNWIGDSSQILGQDQYAVAWNLASIQSPWGQSIKYAYNLVNQSVGNSGLKYSQASYLKSVTDSFGRTITFNYGEKYGRLNPSSKGMVEYQPENYQLPEPNAYQNRYETLYLDSIDVQNAEGKMLYSFVFNYSFFNSAPTSDPNYSLFWKRCLKSVYQMSMNGSTLPSIQFDYNGLSDVNPGALKSITYPSGGVANFVYKKALVDVPKNVTIQSPLSGSVPGVWHGSDYVVFTYCLPLGGLKVLVYSWNGRWTDQEITAGSLLNVKADPDSVLVIAQEDYIALSFRNVSENRDELYLYRKDRSLFGNWTLKQSFYSYLKTSDAETTVIASGADFLVAYNKDYSSAPFQRVSYSWQDDVWTTVALNLPSDAADANGVALSALQNYYIIAYYVKSRQMAVFLIYYRDSMGIWNGPREWINGNIDISMNGDQLLFSWNPQPAFAVATYIRDFNPINNQINYSLSIVQWDENFYMQSPYVVDLQSTFVGPKNLLDFLNTLVCGPTVNNNLTNLRNIGGSVSNWMRKDLSAPLLIEHIAFACGKDAAIISEKAQSQVNQLVSFNPNYPSASGWSTSYLTTDGQYPALSNGYITIGSSIYFYNYKGQWTLLQTKLNNMSDEQSVQNRGPNYIAYQGGSGSNSIGYVVALKNGQAASPQVLSGQKICVLPDEAGSGSILAGPRFLVSYPASQTFKDANSFTLYNLDDGIIGGYTFDYPVGYISVEDAIDPECSFYQSFFYDSSIESQIAYNPDTGIAQYPRVTVVPGIKSMDSEPPSNMPFGFSVFYYSNGLSPQSQLNYQGWIYNYQDLLNGVLLAKDDYNSKGNLVASQLNFWQVYTIDEEDKRLFGGYCRLVRTLSTIDGIETESKRVFDSRTGLVLSEEQTYYDSDGNCKSLLNERTYAWQVKEYASLFLGQHIFTAIAQSTKSVVCQDNQTTNYIESEVTTYRNWYAEGSKSDCRDKGKCRLAPYQTYKWTSPGDVPPEFDFSSNGDQSNWIVVSEVVKRSDAVGAILEEKDVLAVSSSFIYDLSERYLVAKFQNGSLEGEEVNYYGFESFETDQGWILGSGASVIPNSQYPQVDAHTGARSLMLAPSTSDANGLSRAFNPSRLDQSYVLSAWVKKQKGFDPSKGDACWKISVGTNQPMTVQFPDIADEWTYIYQIIDIPLSSEDSSIAILCECENDNSSSYVLIDDIRFSPQGCIFEGFGYDTLFWEQNAQLGAAGQYSRTAFNEFQQPIFTTNSEDNACSIIAAYFSRQGNQGNFSNDDPNSALTIRPAEGGKLFTFSRGSDWQGLWSADQDIWIIDNERLTQKSAQTEGTLSIDDPEYGSDYALEINFDSMETITEPLGLCLGISYKVQWNPKNLQWQLLDGNSNVLSSADAQIFLTSADFASDLNAGSIPSDLLKQFADENCPLPANSTVSSGSVSQKSWVLTSPGSLYRYYLIQINDSSSEAISVCKVASRWIALIQSDSLIFWANGQLIFSYEAPQQFSAAPKLFFGNQVAISILATGLYPQADILFEDSRGIAIQSQKLSDGCIIAKQTIIDSLGRKAVQTKAAYLDTSTNPPLKYCSSFAILDWGTGIMSGLIGDIYKDDNGYPYYRRDYEASPLERETGIGMPGDLFCIGARCTTAVYASIGCDTNDSTKRFLKTTIIDPNGNTYYEVRTTLNQVIFKVSIKNGEQISSATVFDDAQNPIELRSPNYFSPPGTSNQEDWACQQSFDYAGRLKSFVEGNGSTKCFIYDKAGNLRFSQDGQGAIAETFNYVKYDSLNRPIEMGYISGTWDSSQLQSKADSDPSWPPSPVTWRKKLHYDGGQGIDYSIGRLDEVVVNNGDQNEIIECFRYNLQGNVVSRSLVVNAFDSGQVHEIDYKYNDIGNVIQITYPSNENGTRLEIYYRNNRLNQVIAISQQPDFSSAIASFSYLATGELAEERLDLGTGLNIQKSLSFNSPLWPVSINQNNQAGGVLFSESLSYTEGGFNGAGYYDGSIASSDCKLPSFACNFQYSYDPLGQIVNAENNLNADWNLGVKEPIEYDPNGNFQTLFRGNVKAQYEYYDHTERVQQVSDKSDGSILASCGQYDGNGNVKQYSVAQSSIFSAHSLSFDYDPFSNMTTCIIDTMEGGNTLLFSYDGQNQRVLKEVQEGGNLLSKKLYVRGINAYPLCEITVGESVAYSEYIYGPCGLTAFIKDDVIYGAIKDHLGSVRALVDQEANVAASYNYLAFGGLVNVSEPQEGFMPYLFTGQEYDHEVGLYNYCARFYSAQLGRFIGIDPIRQYFSPYIYASNNPVQYIDPDGSMSRWARILLGLGFLAVGVVVTAVAAVFTAGIGGAAAGAAVGSISSSIAEIGATATYTAVNVTTQIAVGVGLGAVSGAALGGGMYSLGAKESFSWSEFGKSAAIGAIGGAVLGGFAQGLSIAGQYAATAVTGVTEGFRVANGRGLQLAEFTWNAAGKYAIRSASIAGASVAIGSLVSDAVTAPITNIWGMTDYDSKGMAASIFESAGTGLRKGVISGMFRDALAPFEAKNDFRGLKWLKIFSYAVFEPW